jgi:hypothetical protein
MALSTLTHERLAQALLDSVRERPWHEARDRRRGGLPFTHPPGIDLAVAVFPRDGAPAWANVLFSREHPEGIVAQIDGRAGAVANVAYLADPVDADGTSIAWQPGSDWQRIDFRPLAGGGPLRFVAPYPASLIKLMVVVGIAHLVCQGSAAWHERWTHVGETRRVADWCEPMITVSSNEATTALVALLHERGMIRREGKAELGNDLHALFASQGLGTLRLADTLVDGRWFNSVGSGVGHLQMTAWDTVRLLWRLQSEPAPWLPEGTPPMLSPACRGQVMDWLAAQQLNQVLSTGALKALPGWVPGIEGRFAHKTGFTESYASDAGRVELPGGGFFLIAFLSSLGGCSAPHPDAVCDWNVPKLGAAVERRIRSAAG